VQVVPDQPGHDRGHRGHRRAGQQDGQVEQDHRLTGQPQDLGRGEQGQRESGQPLVAHPCGQPGRAGRQHAEAQHRDRREQTQGRAGQPEVGLDVLQQRRHGAEGGPQVDPDQGEDGQ